ncbi:mucolipin-3 [Trichonephila clavipes]|nr:mucolipin-3 [Trichonephila clavipes]
MRPDRQPLAKYGAKMGAVGVTCGRTVAVLRHEPTGPGLRDSSSKGSRLSTSPRRLNTILIQTILIAKCHSWTYFLKNSFTKLKKYIYELLVNIDSLLPPLRATLLRKFLATLLDSSFEVHPVVTYGGIAASFADQSEAHPSPDFRMSFEETLVWSKKVVKIIFVTVQLCVFDSDGYIYELQKQYTVSSFQHMLLKDWTALRGVVSYPPSTGPNAVYTKPDLYANIENGIKTYANITNDALGTYCYDQGRR